MLVQKAKAALKSVPALDRLLRSLAMRFSAQGRALLLVRKYCSAVPRVVAEPVFVKVGANDGITGDPFSDLLLANAKWKGLLIEPVPYCFERLQSTFHDAKRFTLERVAIGVEVGESTFYYVDEKAEESIPNLPSWYDQLGSFNKDHILKHLHGALEPFIIACNVEVLPLTDVLKRNGIQKIHLLHIDTEGHDYEVLKTVNFADEEPNAIYVEHRHLPDNQKTEMFNFLCQRGYSVHDCGSDYFAFDEKAGRWMNTR